MTPLVAEGLTLALYGMGTVFTFLTLLVGATMLMSHLVPAEQPAPVAQTGQGKDAKKMAAIAAAIHQHRSD